ncbi:MAG: CBS domain-containing protein [Gemmatimonadaceae bacterium]|nr:CBS domain-containing protein [Gemmatimonadaceae bacterium]
MSSVKDLLARKGTAVISVTPENSVLDAAHVMNEKGIGGVVVMHGKELVGIFTERDIMRRVVAAGRNPSTTLVGDVMTTDCMTITDDVQIPVCRAMMSTRRIRHLPVVHDGGLVGMVTSGDILAFEVAQAEAQIEQLEKYVFDTR